MTYASEVFSSPVLLGHVQAFAASPRAYLFIAGASRAWRRTWQLGGKPTKTSLQQTALSLKRLKWAVAAGLKFDLRLARAVILSPDPIEALSWALRMAYITHSDMVDCEAMTMFAAESGRKNLLRWMLRCRFRLGPGTAMTAAEHGHFDLLRWLRSPAVHCPWDSGTCGAAALKGHMQILRWAHENGCPLDAHVFRNAAGHSDEALAYLRKQRCPIGMQAPIHAAEHGCLFQLQWLDRIGIPMDSAVFTAAAMEGHKDVLEWLLENGCPVTVHACAAAASTGHLKLLQWMRDENRCPWNYLTCKVAARCGQMDVLEWIHANNSPCEHASAEEAMEDFGGSDIESNTCIECGCCCRPKSGRGHGGEDASEAGGEGSDGSDTSSEAGSNSGRGGSSSASSVGSGNESDGDSDASSASGSDGGDSGSGEDKANKASGEPDPDSGFYARHMLAPALMGGQRTGSRTITKSFGGEDGSMLRCVCTYKRKEGWAPS